jgi:hypothetical protein
VEITGRLAAIALEANLRNRMVQRRDELISHKGSSKYCVGLD